MALAAVPAVNRFVRIGVWLVCAAAPACRLADLADDEVPDPPELAQAERDLAAGRADLALARIEPFARMPQARLRARRAWQECMIALRREAEALATADAQADRWGDADSYVLVARLVDADAARAELRTALLLEPTHAFAWYGLAVLAVRAGDIEGARDLATTAIEFDAELPEARRLRAELRDRLADPKGAVADYEALLRLQPADRDAMFNLATLLQGDLADEDTAVELYQRLLQQDPHDARSVVGLAVALTAEGKLVEAERLYLAVRDREPIAWFNLGLLYADHLGRLAEAKQCFEEFCAHQGSLAYGADRALYAPLQIQELERRIAAEKP